MSIFYLQVKKKKKMSIFMACKPKKQTYNGLTKIQERVSHPSNSYVHRGPKKKRRERTGSWRLHNGLLAYQAILASSSCSIIILDLTYYYKNDSLSKWKTIDYLPKKIESPTYEKRSQIELNQVTLQRHNDSRVGISPPSEPDVRVSPHPALCRGISTHCFP